jgi:hypothetical protein
MSSENKSEQSKAFLNPKNSKAFLNPEQKNAQVCSAAILQYGVCAELLASQTAYGQFGPANVNGGEYISCNPSITDAAASLRNQSAKNAMDKCKADPGMFKCFSDMVNQNGLIEKPSLEYCRAYFDAYSTDK